MCRQWTLRSRFHLFATSVDLHIGSLPGFVRGRTETDIAALKALINSPVQTFAPFVRSLNVMGPIEGIYLTLRDLSRLANIATLTIECTGRRILIPPEMEHVLPGIPVAFPRVRALHLVGGEFMLAQFAALACGFAEVESVRLDPVRWTFDDTKRQDAARGMELPQSLRALELGGGTGYYAVLPWMIAHAAPPALHTLVVETTSISLKDFEGLRDLLRVLGPTLRHLLLFLTCDADAWWSKRKAGGSSACRIAATAHHSC